jgi:hypothetical protein
MEFSLDGFPATFRARGSWWWFIVGVPGGYDALNDERQQLLNLCSFYDDNPKAGYMDLEEAFLFVEQGISSFRNIRKLSPASFGKAERELG